MRHVTRDKNFILLETGRHVRRVVFDLSVVFGSEKEVSRKRISIQSNRSEHYDKAIITKISASTRTWGGWSTRSTIVEFA